jgi:hypothetical protein
VSGLKRKAFSSFGFYFPLAPLIVSFLGYMWELFAEGGFGKFVVVVPTC